MSFGIILILSLSLAACQTNTPTPNPSPQPNPTAESGAPTISPQATVTQFLNLLQQAAPPESAPQAIDQAWQLLTPAAQQSVGDTASSASLAQFTGIQDVPDIGFTINGQQTGPANTQEVSVTLNYSGENVEKVFYLNQSENGWQIDSIQANAAAQ